MTPPATIALVAPEAAGLELDGLADLLHACVAAGASVNFVHPFARDEALAFWRDKGLPAVRDGRRLLLVARHEGRTAGCVLLDLDTPPNGAHRAEVSKLLVHPDCRRMGLGRALMARLEAEARGAGRRLLTLDTRTGDAAEPLYAGLGYATAGIVPGYCRHPVEDRLESTTVMYKHL